MAIPDTREARRNAIVSRRMVWFRRMLPTPSAGLDTRGRLSLAHTYLIGGGPAAAPEVAPEIVAMNLYIDRTRPMGLFVDRVLTFDLER